MVSAVKIYIKLCQDAHSAPNNDVIAALKAAGRSQLQVTHVCDVETSKSGELNLRKQTLSSWTWESLGRVLSSSGAVSKVDLSDCLIPSQGVACLLGHLARNTSVHTLVLRGNNIHSHNVGRVGALLKHNGHLKKLSLEWNSLGLFPEMFSEFCEGLSLNMSLESLDLKNNQLPPEVARDLAQAISRNKTLKYLDLRWNNLGWNGGQLLQAALNKNISLIKVKAQGNYIPQEIVQALEQRTPKDVDHLAQSEFLRQRLAHLKNMEEKKLAQHALESKDKMAEVVKLEQERSKELEELARANERKLQDELERSNSRVSQLENILSEHEATISNLQTQLQETEADLKNTRDKLTDSEFRCSTIAVERDERVRALTLQLEEKEAQLARTEADAERRLTSEQRLTAELRARLQSQEEEGERLRQDVAQLNDKLKALARQHEGTLLHEHSLNQELLSKCEREWETRTTKLQRENKVLTERLEVSERGKGELGAQLAMERAQRQEEVALTTQQTRAREAGKLVQLEERVSSLREEKQLLETQLAQSNSNITQLQQQNSSLVAELAEPQRRLAQLHEELSSERVSSERLKQHLAERNAHESECRKKVERLQQEVEALQKQAREQDARQAEREREKDNDLHKLQMLLSQRDKDINNIRADEVERAGVLYSAFSKYLGSLSPSASLPQLSLRT
uniref:Leucine rich repeat containing 45 n=1 Tax=Timema cristinae TaxID=61476 RepID=A0A7R9DES6_TIMCR|nr:unnamed protein product [Timema cristinae]